MDPEKEDDFFDQVDWERLEIASAKLILDQSEKQLKETIDTANQLYNRATYIIGCSIPIEIGLFGYLASKYEKPDFLFLLAFLGFLLMSVVLFLCFKVYYLYPIRPLGNTPKNILSNKEYIAHPDQELVFLYNCIRTAQASSDFNMAKNKERAEIIKTIFYIIGAGLATLLLILIVETVFRP